MKPEWMTWLEENMPEAMFQQFEAERLHDIRWRDEEIARRKAFNDRLEPMWAAICIYCREERGDIDWENDQQAIAWFLAEYPE